LSELNSSPADDRKTKTISRGDLGIVPFVFYQIKMNLGGQERLVYSSVSLRDLSDVNAKLPKTALGANDLIISLKGTIGELSEFYKDREDSSKITGTLYSAGYTFSESELTAKLEALVSSDRTARLLRDEKLEVSKTIETTTNKAAGKLSVNLGFFSFGGGGGKSTTTTTEKNSTQRIYVGQFCQ
jgi:tetrahydromethanopterin S-methyltransferase subunit B